MKRIIVLLIAVCSLITQVEAQEQQRVNVSPHSEKTDVTEHDLVFKYVSTETAIFVETKAPWPDRPDKLVDSVYRTREETPFLFDFPQRRLFNGGIGHYDIMTDLEVETPTEHVGIFTVTGAQTGTYRVTFSRRTGAVFYVQWYSPPPNIRRAWFYRVK